MPFAAGVAGGAAGGLVLGGISSSSVQGAVQGAFSGAVFGVIGGIPMSGTMRVAAHAVAGGGMSVMQGGKFGHGFLSAGVTQAFSGPIDGIDNFGPTWGSIGNRVARVVAAATVGGTTSSITGGSFTNGAYASAFQRAFNEELYDADDEIARHGRALTAEERSVLTDFFPTEVLDSARIIEGKVPWWLSKNMDGITLRNRIYFREGAYAPGTAAGAEILGHELTHVQQYAEGMTYAKYVWQSRKGYWKNPYEKAAFSKGAQIRSSFCHTNPQALGC
jgi:hypothetical protein